MFYRGVVLDNNDPKKIGRVKVRVFGIHDDSNVSASNMPWAEVSGSTEFGLISGVGVSSVLRKGTLVWVFFKEDDTNYPVVFATAKGINSGSGGIYSDPDGVYPKRQGSDMHPNVQGSYTTLSTLETESGHLVELDDTPGNERLKVTHKSGSYIFIDKDGNIEVNSIKDVIYKVAENVTWDIKGKLDIKTGGVTNIKSGGSLAVSSPSTTMKSDGTFGITASTINLN